MRKSLTSVWLVLWLAACASSTPHLQHGDDEDCGDDACVTLVCGDTACGFYRCEDVPGEVVLARGMPPRPPPTAVAPAPGSGPRRNWGWEQELPGQPVMVFPWYGNPKPGPPQLRLPAGKFEKHHIFPQAPDLAPWFKLKGIDIHQYTIPIPVHLHRYIHSNGARGGMWNEAWREFRESNGNAPAEEIFRHAGQLIYRFQLLGGPIQKYN
jgi:uncharacterized lipoprotein (TIGR02269 family)